MLVLLAIVFAGGMVAETFLGWGKKIVEFVKEKTK
jgi:hypothetical protein